MLLRTAPSEPGPLGRPAGLPMVSGFPGCGHVFHISSPLPGVERNPCWTRRHGAGLISGAWQLQEQGRVWRFKISIYSNEPGDQLERHRSQVGDRSFGGERSSCRGYAGHCVSPWRPYLLGSSPEVWRPGGGHEDATAEGSWAVPLPRAPAPSPLARAGPSGRGHAATTFPRNRCPDLLQDASSLQGATTTSPGRTWKSRPTESFAPRGDGVGVGGHPTSTGSAGTPPQSGGVFELSGKVQKTALGLLHLDLATGH